VEESASRTNSCLIVLSYFFLPAPLEPLPGVLEKICLVPAVPKIRSTPNHLFNKIHNSFHDVKTFITGRFALDTSPCIVIVRAPIFLQSAMKHIEGQPGGPTMKVQLAFAPALSQSSFEVLAESMWPPLGVLYLAAFLRDKMPEIAIKVTDGCRIGFKETLREVDQFKPDILGISFYTMTVYGASALARQIKKRFPGIIIVLGGPHVTALPVETLRESGADFAVVGEGEEIFFQIVKTKANGYPNRDIYALPGVYGIEKFGSREIVHSNEAAPFIQNLDSIPSPAWDLIDFSKYKGWFLSKQRPEATIFSARGCPYGCTFCSNMVWKLSRPVLRLRSPENIANEMEMLSRTYGIKEVFDQADEFNNSYQHALAVCAEIKRRSLGMTWKTQLRVKPFTEELARAMAEAGCWYVHLGIESGNQETIDGIEKHILLSDVEETCRLLKKYHIKVFALFMLYNVWEKDGNLHYETSAMCLKTIQFARSLFKRRLIDYISWSVTTPYPGSKLYEIAGRHNLIRPELANNWEAWQKDELFMMSLPGITRKEQGRMKFKGELLRVQGILRNRAFKMKDISFLAKRGSHILIKSFLKRK